MPNWKFYDQAARLLEVGAFSGEEFAQEWETAWLLPGYTFQADIPAYDLTTFTTGGVRNYPTAVDPFFWTPKYPSNWPEVFKRNQLIPQGFLMPGRMTRAQLGPGADDPDQNSLFGESHLWHDTWNNVLRWRCPSVRWTPTSPLPPVQHLIFYSNVGGSPMMLLSLDSPVGPGTYELDWSGGLYGAEEDRYGIVLDVVEA